MSVDFDVIVVGAGVEGSATAHWLVGQGKRTLLLEQFTLPHTKGSSHGQSRTIRKAYRESCYAQMMSEAYNGWQQLERDDQSHFFYQRTGLLLVDSEGDEIDHVIAALQAISSEYTVMNATELKDFLPALNVTEGTRGVLDPEGGVLMADKAVAAFQRQFLTKGGSLHDNEPVLEVLPGDRVRVRTSKSEYSANSLIFTAGAWTNDLIKPLNLNLPLQPLTIKICYWKEKVEGLHSHQMKFPCLTIFGKRRGENFHIFSTPSLEYPGMMKVCTGMGAKTSPANRDQDGDAFTKDVELMSELIHDYLPHLETTPSIVHNCMYTMTPDEGLILDHHPQWKNIIIGAGFSGHGFKLAPTVGRILGELATGVTSSTDMMPFAMSRFIAQNL